jgi:2-dehydropantoate 2-reductase
MQGNRDSNMNIVVMGAGAIGSLFGALLSKKNNVTLIGRTLHVTTMRKNGLKIEGKTQLNTNISAEDSIDKLHFTPDFLILTVKAYNTEEAMNQAKQIIGKDTIVLSLQNGLGNIEKIQKNVSNSSIIAGITTHGALFNEPGIIKHTGKGSTVLGELNGKSSKKLECIVDLFNEAGIETTISHNIVKELWIKAIVNSSINPLTTFFQCKNGYLLENPILKNIVEKICKESTSVANKEGMQLSIEKMYDKTKQVIQDTAENYSSMLQSIRKGKKTEIDSINGRIAEIGRKYGMEPLMNEMLIYSIKSISERK